MAETQKTEISDEIAEITKAYETKLETLRKEKDDEIAKLKEEQQKQHERHLEVVREILKSGNVTRTEEKKEKTEEEELYEKVYNNFLGGK